MIKSQVINKTDQFIEFMINFENGKTQGKVRLAPFAEYVLDKCTLSQPARLLVKKGNLEIKDVEVEEVISQKEISQEKLYSQTNEISGPERNVNIEDDELGLTTEEIKQLNKTLVEASNNVKSESTESLKFTGGGKKKEKPIVKSIFKAGTKQRKKDDLEIKNRKNKK